VEVSQDWPVGQVPGRQPWTMLDAWFKQVAVTPELESVKLRFLVPVSEKVADWDAVFEFPRRALGEKFWEAREIQERRRPGRLAGPVKVAMKLVPTRPELGEIATETVEQLGVSSWQVAEQPSLGSRLPSSHCSPRSGDALIQSWMIPSPQCSTSTDPRIHSCGQVP